MPVAFKRGGMTPTEARKRITEAIKKLKMVYYETGLGMKVSMSTADQKKLFDMFVELDKIRFKI